MRKLLLTCLLLFSLLACKNAQTSKTDVNVYDLPQIKDSGELVVLTLYSSTSYFIYRGQEMGFQYELSQQFARSLGLKMRVEVAKNIPELVSKLKEGKGDMIAYSLPVTKKMKDSLTYCGLEVMTHQVVVQQNNGKTEPL